MGNDKTNAFWHSTNQKQPTTLALHNSNSSRYLREREVLSSVALISMINRTRRLRDGRRRALEARIRGWFAYSSGVYQESRLGEGCYVVGDGRARVFSARFGCRPLAPTVSCARRELANVAIFGTFERRRRPGLLILIIPSAR